MKQRRPRKLGTNIRKISVSSSNTANQLKIEWIPFSSKTQPVKSGKRQTLQRKTTPKQMSTRDKKNQQDPQTDPKLGSNYITRRKKKTPNKKMGTKQGVACFINIPPARRRVDARGVASSSAPRRQRLLISALAFITADMSSVGGPSRPPGPFISFPPPPPPPPPSSSSSLKSFFFREVLNTAIMSARAAFFLSFFLPGTPLMFSLRVFNSTSMKQSFFGSFYLV